MRNGLIGLASAMVLFSTMATAGCGRTGITVGPPGSGGIVGTGDTSSSGGIVGTGDTSSSGGIVGTGGTSSSGGTLGIGGTSSSGGTFGTGGTSSSGGAFGTGGTSSSGGTFGTGGSPSSGGIVGTGGSSSGTGREATCSDVIPCGGDIVGTWTVTSSCLKVTGPVDLSMIGIGCRSAAVTGSLQVTGAWIANSNGTYSDKTTTSGNEQLSLPASCLQVSGATTTCDRLGGVLLSLGYATLSCTSTASIGCTCPSTVKQTGGLGLLSGEPQTNGIYTTSGNVVTIGSDAKYSYCVSGNTMTWTPQSTSPTTTGTVVFQKQ
jgi:hypothetical protein